MKAYEESECACSKCQSMCKTPCIGTPNEMIDIALAGYADRIALTGWAAGMLFGTHNRMVDIIAPLYDEKKGSCTFYTDGRCELHEAGLKPMEGRFASCKEDLIKSKEELYTTPLYKCISEWEKLKL